MVRSKNQHYLPQHYLRRFSLPGGKRIHLYVIDTNTFPPAAAAIKTQCSEDYFYSRDPEFEQWLTNIEGRTETLFSEICRTDSIAKDELTKKDILAAMCVMYGRTRLFVKRINSQVDQAVKAIMKKDPQFEAITSIPKVEIDNFKFSDRRSAQRAVIRSMLTAFRLGDLKVKILKTETNGRFITSDNPVVVANQAFEKLLPGAITSGLSMRGIQLFLPLDPRHCLIAFDPIVYRVGNPSRNCVKVNREEDVQLINCLQVQSADQHLYFADPADRVHIRQLINRFAALRSDKNGFARTVDLAPEDVEVPSFVVAEMPRIKIPATWSFCHVRKDVGAKDFGVRDPELNRLLDDYNSDMTQQERLLPFHVWLSERRVLQELKGDYSNLQYPTFLF